MLLSIAFVLALPLAAGFGWFFGRRAANRSMPSYHLDQSSAHRNQDRWDLHAPIGDDRLPSLLREMHRLNPDNIDIKMALAVLYRDQGDYVRAVEIHRTLLASDSLASRMRADVSLELAANYFAAGLLDRAESCLDPLLNSKRHSEAALALLLQVHVKRKDWGRAIVVAKRLCYAGIDKSREMAHFYCEQADAFRDAQRPFDAWGSLQQAVLVDAHCIRAQIAIADHCLYREKWVKAISHYRLVLEQTNAYDDLVLDSFYSCYHAINASSEGAAWIQDRDLTKTSEPAHLFLIKTRLKERGEREAFAYAKHALSVCFCPSILRATLQVAHLSPDQSNDALAMCLSALERYTEPMNCYVCSACGQQLTQMQWCCFACESWGKIIPVDNRAILAPVRESVCG